MRWRCRWNAFPEPALTTSRLVRVFIQLGAFATGWILVQGITESLAGPMSIWVSQAIGEPVPVYPWAMLAGVLGGCWAGFHVLGPGGEETAVRGVRHLRVATWLGMSAATWRVRPVLLGLALGAASIAATALLLWMAGLLRFEILPVFADAPRADSWGSAALRLLLLLAPAALWEELAFRGFLYGVARDAAGAQVARWASSVAFGTVHIMNPGASLQTTLIVMLAGWCLVLVREQVGVPAAWLAHLAWNWIMAAVLHVAVSGQPFSAPGYRSVLEGPEWLSGGSWGPEGGLVAALVLSTGAGWGWWRAQRAHEQAAVAVSSEGRTVGPATGGVTGSGAEPPTGTTTSSAIV